MWSLFYLSAALAAVSTLQASSDDAQSLYPTPDEFKSKFAGLLNQNRHYASSHSLHRHNPYDDMLPEEAAASSTQLKQVDDEFNSTKIRAKMGGRQPSFACVHDEVMADHFDTSVKDHTRSVLDYNYLDHELDAEGIIHHSDSPHHPDNANHLKKRQTATNLTIDSVFSYVRFFLDYTHVPSSGTQAVLYNELSTRLMPLVVLWYANVLSVRQVKDTLLVSRTCTAYWPGTKVCMAFNATETCGDVTIPDTYLAAGAYCTDSPTSGCTTLPGGDGVVGDNIILVASLNTTRCQTQSLYTYGVPCRQDQYGRPIVSYVNVCQSTFALGTVVAKIMAMTHELSHSLGWTYPLFQQFIHPGNMTLRGTNNTVKTFYERGNVVTKLVTPKVLSKAREHFNCSTLNGYELENQGGLPTTALSHPEKRLYYSDYMNAQVLQGDDVDYTAMTLAVFEDSGWYQVNYTMATPMVWGKNAGCPFVYEKCLFSDTQNKGSALTYVPNSIEPKFFCADPQDQGCSSGRIGKAGCFGLDYTTRNQTIPTTMRYYGGWESLGGYPRNFGGVQAFMDYCGIYQMGSSTVFPFPITSDCRLEDHSQDQFYNVQRNTKGETFGASSRCYMASIVRKDVGPIDYLIPTCYQTSCNMTTQTYTINVNGTTFNCGNGTGTVVSSPNNAQFYGSLTCPPFVELCPNLCLNACSSRGSCVSGTCICPPGTTGADCGTATSTQYEVPIGWGYQRLFDATLGNGATNVTTIISGGMFTKGAMVAVPALVATLLVLAASVAWA